MDRGRQGAWLERGVIALGIACAAALLLGLRRGDHPHWTHLALLAALVLIGDNLAVVLPGNVRAGVALPMALAYLAANDAAPIVAVALLSAVGGLNVGLLHRRKFGIVAFNTALLLLCGAAAGTMYGFLIGIGVPAVVALVMAALTDAAVNLLLLVPVLALEGEIDARSLWRELRSTLPTALALSMLGVLVGGLLDSYGPATVVLLVLPVLVARAFFAASLHARETEEATLGAFLTALEAKDQYTARHTERVAHYAWMIGLELGMPRARLDRLKRAALLHDVGKLAIPIDLLNKPGRLTPEEYLEVQRHDVVVIDLLHRVGFLRELVDLVAAPAAKVRAGDGTLPPIEYHIVHVADAFDAMTSTRAYRKALSMDVAVTELRAKAGEQFWPECVEALIAAIDRHKIEVGAGFEDEPASFAVEPPTVGVGSAGLGDLEPTA